MKRLATVLGGAALLLAPLSAHGQTVTVKNRWNPTGNAGTNTAQYFRSVATDTNSKTIYVSRSTTGSIGISYWNTAAWDVASSPVAMPTGTFATTRPSGAAWTAAPSSFPYGITVDDGGMVFTNSFNDKQIYGYNGDGTGAFVISTDGGTTPLVATFQFRGLHSTGSFASGTLRFYYVRGGDTPGGSGVYAAAQSGGPNSNTFTETLLFNENNTGATNYAVTATSGNDTTYVVSAGASVGGKGLVRYVLSGGVWSEDATFTPPNLTIHDVSLTHNGRPTVSIPGSRIFRVYNLDGTTAGGVNYGLSGQALAVGGVAVMDHRNAFVVGSTGSVSYLEQAYVDAPAVLPVELVSLTAQASGTDAVVRWSTASETNNASFAIEALRGSAWTELATVAGRGTTSERADYETRLSGLGTGRHTLRLVQRDVDGTATVAGTVELVIGGQTLTAEVRGTSVRFASPVAQALTVEAFDVLGRRVSVLFAGSVEAGELRTADLSGVASGVYVVRVSGRSGSASTTATVR